MKLTPEKLSQLLAEARAKAAARVKAEETLLNFSAPNESAAEAELLSDDDKIIHQVLGELGLQANPEQMHFCRLLLSGQNGILIGAAGTGKTTTQGIGAECLIRAGKVKPISGEGTKYLLPGSPGVAILSFTNKAVNNIRWKMPEDLRPNCITIHKLLEYKPIYYEVEVEGKPGEFKQTMRFEPTRNRFNPLPTSLKLLIVEESSMVPGITDQDLKYLWGLLMDAIQHEVQIIMLGDLYQLPPVYGPSILGYKMLSWPVVELTKIFRQAEESPIISLAWKIKNGETINSETKEIQLPSGKTRITVPALEQLCVDGRLLIRCWQKKLSDLDALNTAIKFFTTSADAGPEAYNPDEDIILIPFNKSFGSIELDKGIANHLAKKRGAMVYEIIAGFNKHYLAPGDKVLFEKEDHYIEEIIANADYTGKRPQPASKTLDRWGHNSNSKELRGSEDLTEISDAEVEAFMNAAVANSEEDGERVKKASHTVILRRAIDNETVELESAGDINNIIGGYAITVHKAQGSEWRRVFAIFHWTHNIAIQREMLYTAVTRAKESLTILCEPSTFERGIANQRIKGTTLAEKAEWFKGKLEANEKQLKLEMEIAAREKPAAPKMLRTEDLVDEDTKKACIARFNEVWEAAKANWPKLTIAKPVLLFDLRNKNWIGSATGTRKVRLNGIYLGSRDQEVIDHILNDTIPHEIAHIVVSHLYPGASAHGWQWKATCARLGGEPSRIAKVNFPTFVQAKMDAIAAKLADWKEETEEGEEE